MGVIGWQMLVSSAIFSISYTILFRYWLLLFMCFVDDSNLIS